MRSRARTLLLEKPREKSCFTLSWFPAPTRGQTRRYVRVYGSFQNVRTRRERLFSPENRTIFRAVNAFKKKKKKKRKEASLVFRFSKFLKARSKPPFSRSSLSLEWNSATTENRSRHPVRRERTHAHSHHPAIEAELIALYLIKPRIISLTRADLYSSFLPLQQQASLPSFTIFHLHPCARGWRNRSRGSTVSPLVRQPAGFSCTSLFLFLFFSFSLSRFFLRQNIRLWRQHIPSSLSPPLLQTLFRPAKTKTFRHTWRPIPRSLFSCREICHPCACDRLFFFCRCF